MSKQHDITGTWRGHYEQGGGRHGISMEVVQKGEAFVGRMRDEDTLLSGTVDTVTIDADGDVEAESPPAVTMGVLPEFSIVEGSVEGDAVYFDKRYQGSHEISVWVADRGEAHIEIPDHQVRYEGAIDQDGGRVRGQWRIAGRGETWEDEVGDFELLRQ